MVLSVALAHSPAFAASAVSMPASMTGLKLSADKPIKIDADRLEVHQKDNSAIFSGNVNVTQGPTVMKAGKIVVHYVAGKGETITPGASAIDHIEASGKVYVKSDQQVATGDSATFDMKSEVLVMSGSKVVLTDGDNVAVGCRLTVQMKTGEAKLDGCGTNGGSGRVSIVVAPHSVPNDQTGTKK